MRSRSAAVLASLALLAAGCADDAIPLSAPRTTASREVVGESSSDLWRSIVVGETGPGSSYAMYVPQQWNGTAVFYAHGIRDVLEPISLRDQNDLFAVRDQLGARGYAVAYSSFDDNGYAEPDAARRTHQLKGLFTSQFGAPSRSILAGHSLGGLAALDVAEQHASEYDAVAAFCAIAGGTQAEIDYMATVRILFDKYYPGVLEGTFDQIPSGYVIDPATQQRIVAAVMSNPFGLAVIASVAQAHLEAIPGPQMQAQLVQSLITALSFHARGADNLLSFTNGKFPFDNTQTVYTASSFPLLPAPVLASVLASLNAPGGISRTDGDRSALNWAAHNFTPSGALALPTLTIHNVADPLVPFYHEGLFAQNVTAAGASDRLVQRTTPTYGHCVIPPADLVQGIVDVDEWSRTGIKPAS